MPDPFANPDAPPTFRHLAQPQVAVELLRFDTAKAKLPAGWRKEADGRIVLDDMLADRLVGFKFSDHEKKKDEAVLAFRNDDFAVLDLNAFVPGLRVGLRWGWPGRMCMPLAMILKKIQGDNPLEVVLHDVSTLMETKPRGEQKMEWCLDSEFVTMLAEKWGYTGTMLDIQPTLALRASITQPKWRSDAAQIAYLSRRNGFIWYIDQAGFHWRSRAFGAAPVRIFTYRTGNPATSTFLETPKVEIKPPPAAKTTVKARDPLLKADVEGKANPSEGTWVPAYKFVAAEGATHEQTPGEDTPYMPWLYVPPTPEDMKEIYEPLGQSSTDQTSSNRNKLKEAQALAQQRAQAASSELAAYQEEVLHRGCGATNKDIYLASDMMVCDPDDSNISQREARVSCVVESAAGYATAEQVTAIADARQREGMQPSYKLDFTVIGDATLAAKQIIEVRFLCKTLDGKWFVKEIEHDITPGSYTMTLKCRRPTANDGGDRVVANVNTQGVNGEMATGIAVKTDQAGGLYVASVWVDQKTGQAASAHQIPYDELLQMDDATLQDLAKVGVVSTEIPDV